jgi:hypothetical protein
MEVHDPSHERFHRWKQRLGIFRVPVGVFFLLLAFFLIVTPLTPGSLFALFIGLELLNLREYLYDRLKSLRGK